MSIKKQHYIPRMILKRHTIPFHVPYRKNLVWQLDRLTHVERLVSIRDICYKRNLYELRGDDEHIIEGTRNVVETSLGIIENNVDVIFNKVNEHLELTIEDICNLYWFIGAQMLRMPDFMEYMSLHIQKSNGTLSRCAADRYVKMCSFLLNDGALEDGSLLDITVHNLCEYRLRVLNAVPGLHFLLSGSKPLHFVGFDVFGNVPQFLLFPFSSSQCVLLVHHNVDFCYFDVSADVVRFVNQFVFCDGSRFVYGSVRPSSLLV